MSQELIFISTRISALVGNISWFETVSYQSKYATIWKEMNEHILQIKTAPYPLIPN